MAQFWSKFKFNPNLKAYFHYFSRTFFVVLGVAVVAGLIGLSIFLANKHRNHKTTTPTTTSSPSTRSATTKKTAVSSSKNSANSSSKTASQTSTKSMPNQVINTGPGDIAPLAASLVAIVSWRYYESRKNLAKSR